MRRTAIFILFICSFNFGFVYSQNTEFKELRSDHFIIQYVPEAGSSVYKIKDDAEYYYRAITQEFGLTQANLWAWENRTNIFVAKDKDDYLNRFDCPSWSAACVNYYNRTIYTYPSQENFKQILSHELTHIIFREYIGFGHLPLWVDEGMATYIEQRGSQQEQLTISLIKKLISSNSYIPFSKMGQIYSLSGNIDTSLFYNESFSIIYLLIKRFGREDFAEFLSYIKGGNNCEEALRKAFSGVDGMKGLEEVWKRFYSL